MKRVFTCVAVLCLCLSMTMSVSAERIVNTDDEDEEAAIATATEPSALSVNAKAAVLMDMDSGTVLFEQNSHEALPIASVTKVMTLLLVMDAIDDGRLGYDEIVTVSSRAASMGGSQIWLEENEQMTVEELLKAAVIVSANDACAALAEHLCGTLEAFVATMNERAAALGATDTQFVDCSGLDDSGVSSAHDLALMSRELMTAHPAITKYTTVWMDSLRNGQSELVNTNRLVRFYNGATGLKTGTTAAAGCCLAATAERDGLRLVSVVLGAPSSNDRFNGARSLLDYGFASYAVYTPPAESLVCEPLKVLHGVTETVEVVPPTSVKVSVPKTMLSNVKVRVETATDVQAPVEEGQILGDVVVYTDEAELARYPLTAATAVARLTFAKAFLRFLGALSVGEIA